MDNRLIFGKNWNEKLRCNSYTTIRLFSEKYRKNTLWKIVYNGMECYDVMILDVKTIKINQINDWMAYLDAGVNAEELRKILYSIYRKHNIDWQTQQLSYILLQRL